MLRNWRRWDAGADKRTGDDRFRVAAKIQRGSITEYDEIVGIATRVLNISKLGRAAKKGPELTEAERKQLESLLDKTSDTVFKGRCEEETQPKVNSAVLSKINSEALSRLEACELCDQLKRVNELTLKLGRNKEFTPELRAKFEHEYDRLVAILHE